MTIDLDTDVGGVKVFVFFLDDELSSGFFVL